MAKRENENALHTFVSDSLRFRNNSRNDHHVSYFFKAVETLEKRKIWVSTKSVLVSTKYPKVSTKSAKCQQNRCQQCQQKKGDFLQRLAFIEFSVNNVNRKKGFVDTLC
ncbi:MAG: hypothetical protein K0S25_24 [Bacillus sp. (in: firmicutes)]|jgi:hypothetical protein|nr:hypothetical protein [Bacillus sp. (in: firmicutes)]